LEDYCCLQYDVGYLSTSNKPHGVPSQKAAGFTHTGVKTARISKYKYLFIEGLLSQITRHFKRNFQRESHKTYASIITVTSSYVSRRILAPPSVYRNTLIHEHMNWHTVLTWRICLYKLGLPAGEFCCTLKLTLIYEIWSYVNVVMDVLLC